MPSLNDEYLRKIFNNYYYNAWYNYCIVHILISNYSIYKDIVESLVKEFRNGILLVRAHVRKLQKAISITAIIWGVCQDMVKHLEKCIYNLSLNLESEYLSSSLPIHHSFPQSISNSDLSDVTSTVSSLLLVLFKIPTT